SVRPGSEIRLKGAQGGFYFDSRQHREPLVLISAGSGITPMMSIARTLAATGSQQPCTFVYGARTAADIIFHGECEQLAAVRPSCRYFVTLSQPHQAWTGARGRIQFAWLASLINDLPACRYFV